MSHAHESAIAELLCTAIPLEGEEMLEDATGHLSRPYLEAHDESFHQRGAVRTIADAIEENFAAEVGGPRKAARRPRRVVTPKTHARAPSPAQDDADEDHAAARMARLNLAGRAKVADLRAAIAKVKAEVGSVDGARAVLLDKYEAEWRSRHVDSGSRGGGQCFSLFDFGDLPEFADVETILQQLASPEARRDGLRSVRQLCAADLACCGQWPELCDSLRAALSDPDEECRADAVDVHARFFKEASSQQMAHLFCNLSADALHHVRATAHVVCGFVDEAKASSSLCRKFGALAQMLPALADHLGVLASDQLEHTVTSALLLMTNLLPRRPEGGAAALRSGLLLLPAHWLAAFDPRADWFRQWMLRAPQPWLSRVVRQSALAHHLLWRCQRRGAVRVEDAPARPESGASGRATLFEDWSCVEGGARGMSVSELDGALRVQSLAMLADLLVLGCDDDSNDPSDSRGEWSYLIRDRLPDPLINATTAAAMEQCAAVSDSSCSASDSTGRPPAVSKHALVTVLVDVIHSSSTDPMQRACLTDERASIAEAGAARSAVGGRVMVEVLSVCRERLAACGEAEPNLVLAPVSHAVRVVLEPLLQRTLELSLASVAETPADRAALPGVDPRWVTSVRRVIPTLGGILCAALRVSDAAAAIRTINAAAGPTYNDGAGTGGTVQELVVIVVTLARTWPAWQMPLSVLHELVCALNFVVCHCGDAQTRGSVAPEVVASFLDAILSLDELADPRLELLVRWLHSPRSLCFLFDRLLNRRAGAALPQHGISASSLVREALGVSSTHDDLLGGNIGSLFLWRQSLSSAAAYAAFVYDEAALGLLRLAEDAVAHDDEFCECLHDFPDEWPKSTYRATRALFALCMLCSSPHMCSQLGAAAGLLDSAEPTPSAFAVHLIELIRQCVRGRSELQTGFRHAPLP